MIARGRERERERKRKSETEGVQERDAVLTLA